MLPKLFELPDTSQAVTTYGIMVTLAFCAAFLYIHVRVRKIGVLPDRMLGAYLAAFAGGMLGARVMYVMTTDWRGFFLNPLITFQNCTGGFAVYGGLLGGALAVVSYLVWAKLPLMKLGDIIWPGVIIAMGVGRLGCFFGGCCHGSVIPDFHTESAVALYGGDVAFSSDFPFLALEFHRVSGSATRILDVPLFPTQLWAVFAGLGIGGFLTWLWPKRTFDGQIFALGLLLEPPTRFLIEAFRGDHRGYVFMWPANDGVLSLFPGMAEAGPSLDTGMMGITSSQFGALLLMSLGAMIYARGFQSGVLEEEVEVNEDDLLLAASVE